MAREREGGSFGSRGWALGPDSGVGFACAGGGGEGLPYLQM